MKREWIASLKHAFAVDPPGPAEPTAAQAPVVDYLCYELARRGMATPAVFGLQMSMPLNYLGSQLMHALEPIISVLFDTEAYARLAAYLERRGSLEYMSNLIEQYDLTITAEERRMETKAAANSWKERFEAQRAEAGGEVPAAVVGAGAEPRSASTGEAGASHWVPRPDDGSAGPGGSEGRPAAPEPASESFPCDTTAGRERPGEKEAS